MSSLLLVFSYPEISGGEWGDLGGEEDNAVFKNAPIRIRVQIPKHPHRESGMIKCMPVISALWEIGLPGLAGCQPSSRFSEKPSLKAIKQRVILQVIPCPPPAAYGHKYPHICKHIYSTHFLYVR